MRKITIEGFNVVVVSFTVNFFSLRLTEILVLYYHCLKTSEKKKFSLKNLLIFSFFFVKKPLTERKSFSFHFLR